MAQADTGAYGITKLPPGPKIDVPLPSGGPTAPDVYAPLAQATPAQLGVSQQTYDAARTPTTGNAADWEAYLTNYGFTEEIKRELRRIFQSTPDVQSAQAQALAYIRGTQWYDQTFPGIKDAIKMGIISDERDYRNNFNTFNQVYRQYTGRDLTAQEYANSLREGITAETAARRFQGAANVAAYGNDWQYLAGAFGPGRLSEADLKAQGEQQAGISTGRGTFLDKALQQAEARMRRAFEGVLATPGFSQSATGRILSPGLSGGNIGDIGR